MHLTDSSCHLVAKFHVSIIITHREEIIPPGVEAQRVVPVAASIGRSDRHHSPQQRRVVGNEFIGPDSRQRSCGSCQSPSHKALLVRKYWPYWSHTPFKAVCVRPFRDCRTSQYFDSDGQNGPGICDKRYH